MDDDFQAGLAAEADGAAGIGARGDRRRDRLLGADAAHVFLAGAKDRPWPNPKNSPCRCPIWAARSPSTGSRLTATEDLVARINDKMLLPAKDGIGLDPAGVGMLVDEIVSRGISDELMRGISQGYRLQPAIFAMERKLKDATAISGAGRNKAGSKRQRLPQGPWRI